MSRLYGKSVDVFSISRVLVDSKIPKYKNNNKKTTWDEVARSPEIIDLYLPEKAQKLIEENPIRIVSNPLVVKKAYMLSNKKDEESTVYYPKMTPVEEYKRELVFFLGEILSNCSPDKVPSEYYIPCEFSNALGLLLEYLYLKETGQENIFSSKHINELIYNAKKYVKSYLTFQNILVSNNKMELLSMTEEQQGKYEERFAKSQEQFLEATLTCLVPLSSLEGVLQIIDMYKDKDQIKKLIDELVTNKGQDRQSILSSIGIETAGYKRLRKEIERRR